MGSRLEPRHCFGSYNRNIKIHCFAMVNHTKVQFGDRSLLNNHGKDSERSCYENCINFKRQLNLVYRRLRDV